MGRSASATSPARPIFAVGSVYTNKSLSSRLRSKVQGGIRYSGRFPNIQEVAAIETATPDAIYGDLLRGASGVYIGEGQVGDQAMKMGNRVLVWCHFQAKPIHVFKQLSTDRYRYEGAAKVVGVKAAVAIDRNRRARGVFEFQLKAEPRTP